MGRNEARQGGTCMVRVGSWDGVDRRRWEEDIEENIRVQLDDDGGDGIGEERLPRTPRERPRGETYEELERKMPETPACFPPQPIIASASEAVGLWLVPSPMTSSPNLGAAPLQSRS